MSLAGFRQMLSLLQLYQHVLKNNKETSNLWCVCLCEQCVTKYQSVEFKWDRYFINKVETQLRENSFWGSQTHVLVFWLAAFCWQKSLLCNVTAFTGMPFSSESSRYSEFVIWYGKSLIMTRSVSQASRRNFQTPRRLCNIYSSAKVGSRVYRPNGLVKPLDTY